MNRYRVSKGRTWPWVVSDTLPSYSGEQFISCIFYTRQQARDYAKKLNAEYVKKSNCVLIDRDLLSCICMGASALIRNPTVDRANYLKRMIGRVNTEVKNDI